MRQTGNLFSMCLCFFLLALVIGEEDAQSVFYVFVFFLNHLVANAHPSFQATVNMSGGSGTEDWTNAAGSTPAASVENPLGRAINTLTREQLLRQIR